MKAECTIKATGTAITGKWDTTTTWDRDRQRRDYQIDHDDHQTAIDSRRTG